MDLIFKGVFVFGSIEVIIGSLTLISVVVSLIIGISTKPLEILIFVLAAAGLSFCLGIGILKLNPRFRRLLILFASLVILSKVLSFFKIITMHGALLTIPPEHIRDTISIIYHLLIIWYFNLPSVKLRFGEGLKT